ncbi:YybH family protein [Paenibacillus caui]|uniref:YybH family protein n=1 Tax=Paenibacillus caui TaxID=2873927 RepID=UPI001CAA3884|nr:DUF4440 domain-containing protein [Paenibacillus caui]
MGKEDVVLDWNALLEQYIAATNTHHFDQVEKLLSPRAVYWFSDKTCATLPEIRDYFEQAWRTVDNELYSISDVVWIAENEHSAVCLYTYHWEGYVSGTFVSGSGRGTNVFAKEDDGSRKLIHEHLSASPRQTGV